MGVVVLNPLFGNADGEREEAPPHSLVLSAAGSFEGVRLAPHFLSRQQWEGTAKSWAFTPNLLAWEM